MFKGRMCGLVVLIALLFAVGSVGAYALEPAGKIGSAAPGNSVRGAALSLDEKYLYIAGVQDMAVWKYDAATGEMVASVRLSALNPGAYGKAVFVDKNGHVWAPGTVPELYQFDADLNLIATYDLRPFGIVNPEGAVVLADGSVIVSDRSGSVGVWKFTVADGKLERAASFGDNGHVALGSDVRQLAIAADGAILVGDYASTTIYKVDPETGAVSTFASDLANPYHLATDAAGNVYVVHYSDAVGLTILDAAGNVVTTSSRADLGITSEASGIAVTADGKTLYILDQRPADGGGARVFTR